MWKTHRLSKHLPPGPLPRSRGLCGDHTVPGGKPGQEGWAPPSPSHHPVHRNNMPSPGRSLASARCSHSSFEKQHSLLSAREHAFGPAICPVINDCPSTAGTEGSCRRPGGCSQAGPSSSRTCVCTSWWAWRVRGLGAAGLFQGLSRALRIPPANIWSVRCRPLSTRKAWVWGARCALCIDSTRL